MPNPPLAVTTGSFHPLPTVESLRLLQSLGLTEVELTLQADEFYIDLARSVQYAPLPFLVEQSQAGALRVHSLHATLLGRDQGYSLAARLEYLARTVDLAVLLGAGQLVVHPSHLFHSYEATLDFLAGETPLPAALLPGLGSVFETARAAGLLLALENIQHWNDQPFFSDASNMRRFLDAAAGLPISATLDLMHAAYAGGLNEFFELLPEAISNVHIADWLPPVRRLPPGQGVLNWPRLLPALRALPNLRQWTLELANPSESELLESVEFLKTNRR